MAAVDVRVWFKLEGAASATSAVMPDDALVDDLRDKIKEKLAADVKDVPASRLVLSTANGTTTYGRASAPVSDLNATSEDRPLIVTGTWSLRRWLSRSPCSQSPTNRRLRSGLDWHTTGSRSVSLLSCCRHTHRTRRVESALRSRPER